MVTLPQSPLAFKFPNLLMNATRRSQSHKWTVYIHGASNEDLGAVIKRVVFQLQPSGLKLHNPVPIETTNQNERGDTKEHRLSQWFMKFSEADEFLKLAAARQQVSRNLPEKKQRFGYTIHTCMRN